MKWISCAKKLPKEEGLYLVCRKERKILIKIREYRSWINNDRKRFWSNGSEDKKITHWIPLPELPKED